MTTILVLNGPNLGRLGTREPEVYGSETLADIGAGLAASVPDGVEIDLRQTDDEAELIGWIHEAVDDAEPRRAEPRRVHALQLRAARRGGPAARRPACRWSRCTSRIRTPARTFRHTSVISGVATGVIAGFGADSYRLAVDWVLRSRG